MLVIKPRHPQTTVEVGLLSGINRSPQHHRRVFLEHAPVFITNIKRSFLDHHE